MMNKRSTTCSRRSRARGLTLIEVVAAIAILGTLLVGIVLSKARHTRQLTRAQVQARAVVAADELIAGWWARSEGVPIDARGVLPGRDRLSWRTRLVENDGIQGLGARVVRVEVSSDLRGLFEDDAEGGQLFVVDLVVPDPDVEAEERAEDKAGGSDA